MARLTGHLAFGLVFLAVLPGACTLIFGDYEVRGGTGAGGSGGSMSTTGSGGASSSSSGSTSSSTSSSTSTTSASSSTTSSSTSTSSSSSTTSSSTSSTTSSSSSTTSSSTSSTTSSSSSTGGGPKCGNGTKEVGEQCDDGNTLPADGCSPTCQIENPDTCPGTAILLTSAGLTVIDDTTNASLDTGELPCGGANSGEFVYHITAAQAGMLVATLTGSGFTPLLYARSSCPGVPGTNLACNHAPANITVPMQAGESIYLFVDGYGGSQEGPFVLTLDLI